MLFRPWRQLADGPAPGRTVRRPGSLFPQDTGDEASNAISRHEQRPQHDFGGV
jgi:hypothetical protein